MVSGNDCKYFNVIESFQFNSSAIMCYVMKTKYIKLYTVKSHPSVTSQTYSNNDVLLFPLQCWKQPPQIKCSDQFKINKRDTGCFEHLHEVNASVSHVWIFSWTSGFLLFLQRGVEEWRNSNRMGEGCCSFGYFLPPHFGRKECC